MKNKSLKVFSLIFAVVLSSVFFVGCSIKTELKKVSKNLTNYKIDAVFNSEDMSIDANMTAKVVNKTDVALENLCFNLYGRAFREEASVKPYTSINEGKCFPNGVNYGDLKVLKVSNNGTQKQVTYVGDDSNALQVPLNERLEPGDKTSIEMEFKLTLAESIHRLGYFEGSVNLGNWFPILAMYEKGEFNVTPYYSTGDPFYSDIANFDVNFTYPEEYVLASTGNILSNSQGKAVIKSQATRDFAMTLTKCANINSKKVGETTVTYVGYQEDENIDYCLDVAAKAVSYFSKTFGTYPYESLTVVKAPFLHGGMEYPELVLISDSITDSFDVAKVIVHEIAHQWWYAVVGNNQISEAWLDESLAEYSSILFFEGHGEYDVSYEELVSEAFAGYLLYADIISTVNGKIQTSMLLSVNEYFSEYEYSYMIYVRGVLMFDSLRQVVGANKLKTALKKYYDKYKFKFSTTDSFIASMRKSTGKDIEGFLDGWLSGSTVVGAM